MTADDRALWAAFLFALSLAITLSVLGFARLAHAAEPDAITRQLGLEMLRTRMLERCEQQRRAIDWQAPGYWGVGYNVRIG